MSEKTRASYQSPNVYLEGLLKCIICYKKLVDAKMCPFCQNLFCKNCIHDYLIDYGFQCPFCTKSLRLDQIIPCRFLNEIASALEQVVPGREETFEKCPKHGCPITYFCLACDLAICSDCAVFDPIHKGHEFARLFDIYKKHVDQINTESNWISEKIEKLESILSEIDSKIKHVEDSKNQITKSDCEVFEKIQNRLEIDLKEKINCIVKLKEECLTEIEKLQKMQNEVEKELNHSEKSKLISKSAKIIENLQKISSSSINFPDDEVFVSDFVSELIPEYNSGLFVLRGYSQVLMSAEVVYSEVLSFTGMKWRLKVYPNGNGIAKNVYLSVFIELVEGHEGSSKYDYRVEMENVLDQNLNVVREFTSDFETGECWGYNRFYRIDLLKQQGFLSNDDSLIIKFYIKPNSYYQLCIDQQHFINGLIQKEHKKKQKTIELFEKLGQIEEIGINGIQFGEEHQGITEKNEETKIEDIFSQEISANPLNKNRKVMKKLEFRIEKQKFEEDNQSSNEFEHSENETDSKNSIEHEKLNGCGSENVIEGAHLFCESDSENGLVNHNDSASESEKAIEEMG